MNPRYPIVSNRAAHRCEYCRAPEAVFKFRFEVEHVVPPGRGGTDSDDNLALSCRSCNVFKSNHVEAHDPESRNLVALFNPRLDNWDEHFEADVETGTIRGISAIGRATSALLRMNEPAQTTARRQ